MSPEQKAYTLKVEDLAVALGKRPILGGIQCSLLSGSWVGILGPNGSGKTTLLRALAGHLPYNGSATLNGKEIRDWNRRQLALVLSFMRQHLSLQFDINVEDFVLLGRLPHQRWLEPYSKNDNQLIEAILEGLQLTPMRQRPVRSLSGGEQQRAMLAQSLAQHAHILFLDEPTAHVDIHYQYAFLERIREQVDKGSLVLSVFHNLELAARYCDQLLVLEDGQMAGFGPPHDIITESLIARVFRMQCEIHRNEDKIERIFFNHPL